MGTGSRDLTNSCNRTNMHNGDRRFLLYIDTRPNGDALRKCILTGPYTPTMVTTPAVPATEDSPEVPAKTSVETMKSTQRVEHSDSIKKCGSHQRYKGRRASPNQPHLPSEFSNLKKTRGSEQAQKDKDMQKNLALIAKYFKKLYKPTNNNLRTSSNTRNKNVDTNPRYKTDNQTGQFGNQRAVNVVGARETVGVPGMQQSGITVALTARNLVIYAKECRKAKQEIDEQELEAHYSYMAKIQEVPNADSGTDAEPLGTVQYDTIKMLETGDSNVIPDSPDMCDNDIQDDQNDVECDNERAALANLIANLKLDVDDNKKIQKQLKKANATLTQELTECKSILAETSRTLGESNSIRDRLLAQKDIDIQEGLKVKAYEISVVQAKHDELVKQSLLTRSHYEGLVKEKTKSINPNHSYVSTQIAYINGRSTFANPMYLKKAQYEHPGLYAITQDQSDPATRLIPDSEEILTLADKSRSKLNKDLVKPFDYTKLNSLYEIFKPPTQHYEIQFAQANEIRKKMWRKSFVKTKPNVFKNIDFLPVSKSVSKSRQAYNVMTNNINHLSELVNQAWVKHSNDHLYLRHPTAQDMEILVKKCLMPLALKTQDDSLAFIHELKKEMHADLKYVESLEDELDELESDKAEFSNMYDMLLQECVSKDVMCSYLLTSSDLDEITELQCLYLHKVMECDCLAQKLSAQTDFVSKEIYTELLQRFARLEKHSISLEIALQECQVQLKNDKVCKEKASNVFRKEREQYVEIQDLKAQLQDKNMAISELKKLVAKCKGKSVDTKFDKPSVVRQPNAQRLPKPSVLGKPAPFSDSLERKYFAKKKSVLKTNESESLSKPVTLQNLPQTAMQAVRNTNVIKPGMYRIASSTTQTRAPQLNQTFRNTNPCASTSTGIAHKTNVSRPQPRGNQMKDKSVTACNDSLNSRSSNANAVCTTCGKCVFNSNHDACVSKYLNDVNARTKKPNVVPISTRKPKRQANKSVATPHKKTVASESTTTSSKSYYRMLYQKTSKAWKWWIAQQCPSSYTWVPKTQKKWVPRVKEMDKSSSYSIWLMALSISNVSMVLASLAFSSLLRTTYTACSHNVYCKNEAHSSQWPVPMFTIRSFVVASHRVGIECALDDPRNLQAQIFLFALYCGLGTDSGRGVDSDDLLIAKREGGGLGLYRDVVCAAAFRCCLRSRRYEKLGEEAWEEEGDGCDDAGEGRGVMTRAGGEGGAERRAGEGGGLAMAVLEGGRGGGRGEGGGRGRGEGEEWGREGIGRYTAGRGGGEEEDGLEGGWGWRGALEGVCWWGMGGRGGKGRVGRVESRRERDEEKRGGAGGGGGGNGGGSGGLRKGGVAGRVISASGSGGSGVAVSRERWRERGVGGRGRLASWAAGGDVETLAGRGSASREKWQEGRGMGGGGRGQRETGGPGQGGRRDEGARIIWGGGGVYGVGEGRYGGGGDGRVAVGKRYGEGVGRGVKGSTNGGNGNEGGGGEGGAREPAGDRSGEEGSAGCGAERRGGRWVAVPVVSIEAVVGGRAMDADGGGNVCGEGVGLVEDEGAQTGVGEKRERGGGDGGGRYGRGGDLSLRHADVGWEGGVWGGGDWTEEKRSDVFAEGRGGVRRAWRMDGGRWGVDESRGLGGPLRDGYLGGGHWAEEWGAVDGGGGKFSGGERGVIVCELGWMPGARWCGGGGCRKGLVGLEGGWEKGGHAYRRCARGGGECGGGERGRGTEWGRDSASEWECATSESCGSGEGGRGWGLGVDGGRRQCRWCVREENGVEMAGGREDLRGGLGGGGEVVGGGVGAGVKRGRLGVRWGLGRGTGREVPLRRCGEGQRRKGDGEWGAMGLGGQEAQARGWGTIGRGAGSKEVGCLSMIEYGRAVEVGAGLGGGSVDMCRGKRVRVVRRVCGEWSEDGGGEDRGRRGAGEGTGKRARAKGEHGRGGDRGGRGGITGWVWGGSEGGWSVEAGEEGKGGGQRGERRRGKGGAGRQWGSEGGQAAVGGGLRKRQYAGLAGDYRRRGLIVVDRKLGRGRGTSGGECAGGGGREGGGREGGEGVGGRRVGGGVGEEVADEGGAAGVGRVTWAGEEGWGERWLGVRREDGGRRGRLEISAGGRIAGRMTEDRVRPGSGGGSREAREGGEGVWVEGLRMGKAGSRSAECGDGFAGVRNQRGWGEGMGWRGEGAEGGGRTGGDKANGGCGVGVAGGSGS
ncbi:hypothetical protein Tco_0453013 [Tanacetum coccineum]